MKFPRLRPIDWFFIAVCVTCAGVVLGFWMSQEPAKAQCAAGYMVVVGPNGSETTCGPPVPATWNFSAPTSRTISLATAYQCSNTAAPCVITVNLQSTAAISLSGGTTNTANALVGSTNGVASGTGTIQCIHGNSNTGTLTIGLNLNTISTTQCTLPIPIGYYFAVRQIAGTVTITSTFENTAG